jgi:hypothetical protein
MATLSLLDDARLGAVRPELRQLLASLWEAATTYGYTLAIPANGGRRSHAAQVKLYADSAQGTRYAVAQPGRSRHEYGAAVDLNIIAGGYGDGGTGADSDYRWLADAAESLGLVAGFYFDARGEGLHDPYHFQLKESLDVSIASAPASTASLLLLVIAGALLAYGIHRAMRKR